MNIKLFMKLLNHLLRVVQFVYLPAPDIFSPTQKIERYREIELLRLKRTLASTPAQRLAWLEEALEFAYEAGALPLKTNID